MSKLPKRFTDFVDRYPAVGKSYHDLGKAVAAAGPLDNKTRELIKIGIAITAGLEGGTPRHGRQAPGGGATQDEIRHAALQCLTPIGFPAMMEGLSWNEDIFNPAEGV